MDSPNLSLTELCTKEAHYFDPELSWLAFNERVYAASRNPAYPLLERVRFLGIAANNLDEFYMVHLAALQKGHSKSNQNSTDALSKEDLIHTLKGKAMEQIANHGEHWHSLNKKLREKGVSILSPHELSEADKKWLENYFIKNIFPILTPMVIDPAHPVPQLPNRSLTIAVHLQDKHRKNHTHAFIPLPLGLERYICLPGEEHRYVFSEQVINMFLPKLFSHHKIVSEGLFRIVRNAEMSLNQTTFDLRKDFEEALSQRLKGEVVQLAVNARMPEELKLYVMEQFGVNPNDMLVIDGMLGLNDLQRLVSLCDKKELLFPDWKPRFPQRIHHNDGDIFESIKAKDLLLHHPYENFEVVLKFLRKAAKDRNVISIKQTLYRTGDNSPIVAALIEAAKAGKSVTVLVEIKARFDEETNIKWTKDLEQAGAHVVYGVMGLKTHAKVCLVVRKEAGGLQTYTHLSTGNYNVTTARLYTDVSLLTADPRVCYEVACIFNYMTSYSPIGALEDITAAPFNLRENLLDLINKEIKFAQQGKPACIWAKMNSLTDTTLIDALYKASNAGVQISLVVRGMCCLRPGVPNLSENITVKSIVGRFLEHARIFCFGNGSKLPSPAARVFISSADWMPRNLDNRLEVMVNIKNPTVHQQLLQQIMFANLNDTANSWKLLPNGTYIPLSKGADEFNAHQFFIDHMGLSGSGIGPYSLTPKIIRATSSLSLKTSETTWKDLKVRSVDTIN